MEDIDQQLQISIGLRLGDNICDAQKLNGAVYTFFSGTKSAGRFSRHATLNSFIKQALRSLDLPSMLEPRGLYRTDRKLTDGVTMIPWEMDKQLV